MNHTPTKKLSEYRKEIDSIDQKIISLLADRTEIIFKVAKHKKLNNIPAILPGRIEEVIQNNIALGKQKNINPNLIQAIYDEIIKEAIEIEEKIIKADD